jgi:uroporphyrinogen-III decarboxylase
MTGREKIEAAFSPDGTPEIPVVICYEGIYVRDHWSQLTSHPWWYRSEPNIDRQVTWRRDMIDRTRLDWFGLPLGHSRDDRERVSIVEEGGRVFRVDGATGERAEMEEPQVSGWSASGGQHSIHPKDPPLTEPELDERLPPADAVDAESLRADGCFDLPDRLLQEFGDSLCPVGGVSTPLWGCYSLWGFEGMMTMVADRPDLVRYASDRIIPHKLEGLRGEAARGARVIWIEECLTDMVSPEAFEALNLPYLRQLTDEVRSLGMKSIYYFCGDPTGKWDLLLEAGADALSLEESKKGFDIDIENVVSKVDGKCAVLGNLDAIDLLCNGSEDDLRTEISRQITAGRQNNGRFIMSIGSPVTPETTVDRVRLYCDMAREIGASL